MLFRLVKCFFSSEGGKECVSNDGELGEYWCDEVNDGEHDGYDRAK